MRNRSMPFLKFSIKEKADGRDRDGLLDELDSGFPAARVQACHRNHGSSRSNWVSSFSCT